MDLSNTIPFPVDVQSDLTQALLAFDWSFETVQARWEGQKKIWRQGKKMKKFKQSMVAFFSIYEHNTKFL